MIDFFFCCCCSSSCCCSVLFLVLFFFFFFFFCCCCCCCSSSSAAAAAAAVLLLLLLLLLFFFFFSSAESQPSPSFSKPPPLRDQIMLPKMSAPFLPAQPALSTLFALCIISSILKNKTLCRFIEPPNMLVSVKIIPQSKETT